MDEQTPHATCGGVTGPFYHGTRHAFAPGALLVPGRPSNFEARRVSNNVYFSATLDAAVWGAELAVALAGHERRGHIYVVEPTGPFEDDPNLTNKRFPGNRTRSYRTREPLRIVGEVHGWTGHPPELVRQMLDHLAALRQSGDSLIED